MSKIHARGADCTVQLTTHRGEHRSCIRNLCRHSTTSPPSFRQQRHRCRGSQPCSVST
jgi:hypothetical protein